MTVQSVINRLVPRTVAHRILASVAALAVAAAGAGVIVGVANAAAASPAFDPQDAIRPVASYTFDGDTGSVVTDSSGNGNDASWKGTPSYVGGVSGKAAVVGGGSNYIKLPRVAGKTDASSSFSYEFWISEQSRTSYGPIISNQDFDSCNNAGITL